MQNTQLKCVPIANKLIILHSAIASCLRVAKADGAADRPGVGQQAAVPESLVSVNRWFPCKIAHIFTASRQSVPESAVPSGHTRSESLTHTIYFYAVPVNLDTLKFLSMHTAIIVQNLAW